MKYFIIIEIMLLSLLMSCKKEAVDFSEINFTHNTLNFDIVISGFVSTEKAKCLIQLSSPELVGNELAFSPINDATIQLTDGFDTFDFELDSDGLYRSINPLQGIVGRDYKLTVSYNGKEYFAEDIMPEQSTIPVLPPFEREVTYDDNGNPLPPNDNFFQFSILNHLFGYTHLNIWQINENRDSLGRLLPKDIYHLGNNKIYTHEGSLPQGVFPSNFHSTSVSGLSNDSLEIIKFDVSESYSDYTISRLNVTVWKGGIFSTIEGNTKTNVSEGGTGFFYATNITRSRLSYKDLAF